MSTTQGPYTVERPDANERIWAVYDGDERVSPYTSLQHEAEYVRDKMLLAYAAGQSSKQAELDKAVELLREVGYFITDHCPDNLFADELVEKIDAYLSTLNPQPHAAQ